MEVFKTSKSLPARAVINDKLPHFPSWQDRIRRFEPQRGCRLMTSCHRRYRLDHGDRYDPCAHQATTRQSGDGRESDRERAPSEPEADGTGEGDIGGVHIIGFCDASQRN